MKKLLLFFAVALFVGCVDYTDDFNAIDERLDALELKDIPSIEEQIESINAQLVSLKATDDAIKAQISELEKSDQVAVASDIADLKEKNSALEKSINDLQNYVDTQIANAKSEAAAAYATVEQYNTIVAKLNALQSSATKLGEDLTAKINTEVASLNGRIADLEARLKAVEDKVENLLARIQSVSYIPTYSDGKATLEYTDSESKVTLDFEISPKDAVAELAKVWDSAISVKAVYTQTRAVSFVDMPIINFEADAEKGVISITASGENLSADFIAGKQEASIALVISDGNNSVTSEYVPITIKNEIKNEKISFTSLQRIDDDIKVFSVANQNEDLSQYTTHLDGAKFIYNPISTSWIGESDHYWPANGCSYILATCPYSLNATITTKMAKNGLIEELSLLGIENDPFVQQDILYSDLLYVELPQNTTPTIKFNHALTQINISFKKTDSPCNVILKSVKLCNVGTAGDLRIYPNIQGKSTASWAINKISDSSFCKNDTTNLDIVLTSDTTCILEPKLILPSNQTAIMFVYTVDDHEMTYTHSLSGNWEMGHKYTYNYTINVNEIIIDRTIEDWGFTDDTITI